MRFTSTAAALLASKTAKAITTKTESRLMAHQPVTKTLLTTGNRKQASLGQLANVIRPKTLVAQDAAVAAGGRTT